MNLTFGDIIAIVVGTAGIIFSFVKVRKEKVKDVVAEEHRITMLDNTISNIQTKLDSSIEKMQMNINIFISTFSQHMTDVNQKLENQYATVNKLCQSLGIHKERLDNHEEDIGSLQDKVSKIQLQHAINHRGIEP